MASTFKAIHLSLNTGVAIPCWMAGHKPFHESGHAWRTFKLRWENNSTSDLRKAHCILETAEILFHAPPLHAQLGN